MEKVDGDGSKLRLILIIVYLLMHKVAIFMTMNAGSLFLTCLITLIVFDMSNYETQMFRTKELKYHCHKIIVGIVPTFLLLLVSIISHCFIKCEVD